MAKTWHRSRMRGLWGSIGLIALVNGLFVLWVLLKPGSHDTFVTGDNLGQLAGNLLGIALCFAPLSLARGSIVARRGDKPSSVGGAQRRAPLFLGLAIVSEALGQAIYTYYEDVLHVDLSTLFPSWSDAVYLSVYPFALVGILLLSRRPLSLASRARVVLDGLMLMTALVTFSWYFILGPTVLQGGQTLFATIVGAAYPLGDLLLVLCLLLLAARATDGRHRLVLGILGLALGVIVATDSIYDYQLLHSGYATGTMLDVGWALGYSLLGLGARALRRANAAPAAVPTMTLERPSIITAELPEVPSLWRSLTPYAFVPAVIGLVVYVWLTHGSPSVEPGVYVGAAVLIALVLVRQIVAIREAINANRALRTMYIDNAALTAANTQLEVIATTDALTGLPNRPLLHDRLADALSVAERDGSPVALLLMDLDRFKEVNDTLGHHYGDLLLQQIGPRIKSLLRATDTIARLGGDEFAIVLPGADAAGATVVARTILHALDTPFRVDGHALDVGASIGTAIYPTHGADTPTLLRCADVAMYVAKRTHSGVMVYDSTQDGNSAHRLSLMSDLRQALTDDALELYYQPKIDLAHGDLTGVEALLRWPHPTHGFIPPDHFIPLAEHTGLIAPLTQWVLEAAVRQGQSWQERRIGCTIAVNLSMRILQDLSLPDTVAALLRRYNFRPERLTLEITESALMADPTRALEVLTRLSALGVHLAIDDFGTGYSSLGYLKQLPVDEVKIDKSFVMDVDANAKDAALVRSIIAMAHALGLEVVAEGVETAKAWDLLHTLGCDVAQGYYMSRPLPASEFERWMSASPWGWRAASA